MAIDLSAADLDEILRLSSGDDVALTLDGDGVAGLFDDPDVEAHGLKGAIAIAVTSAAILAPAGHAATQQSVGAAATAQRPASPRLLRSRSCNHAGIEGCGQDAGGSIQAKLARVRQPS